MKLPSLPNRPVADSTDPVAVLRRLGFSGYEAAVWLELANGFPVTAYQLAKRAGLQRANTYKALERLLELEAVILVNADPATYAPVDPKVMVTRLTAGLMGECEHFAASMSRRVNSRNQGQIRTGHGTDACFEWLRRELATAQKFLWLKGESATLRLLEAELQSAVRRGLEVTVIAFGSWQALQNKLTGVRVFPHEGTAQRLSGATDALLTLARDGRSVTTAVFSESPTVTSIQDHALTYQLHSYLLHEIFLAELVLGEGGGHVGERLQRLRARYRPPQMEHPLLPKRRR
ncbi:MAG: helix-turn-helix domain-containing protein [Polaromonas sp.]|nr:helix-turn-helix domain-containing protein [Polaromonas sp.]